ncbi:MAG: FecR family protein [Rhodospirillaceae bacterium]|nr:FecR family protein [Rhodospirillaceae bacterium]
MRSNLARGFLFLLILIAVLVPGGLARAAEAGYVMRLAGTVELIGVSGAVPLASGSPIQTGDRIRTGPDSRVQIELEGGAVLTLGADSELLIPAQAARTVSIVDLLLGIVRAVLPESTSTGFLVRGRTAVASVRSTEWIVETSPENTSVFAIEGKVQVTGTGGSVTLQAGEGTDVPAASLPSAPKQWGAARAGDALARTAAH